MILARGIMDILILLTLDLYFYFSAFSTMKLRSKGVAHGRSYIIPNRVIRHSLSITTPFKDRYLITLPLNWPYIRLLTVT